MIPRSARLCVLRHLCFVGFAVYLVFGFCRLPGQGQQGCWLKTSTQSNKNVHTQDERDLEIKSLIWSVLELVLKNLGSVFRRKSMTQNMRFDDSRLKGKGDREYIAAIEVAEPIPKGSFNQICTKFQKHAP